MQIKNSLSEKLDRSEELVFITDSQLTYLKEKNTNTANYFEDIDPVTFLFTTEYKQYVLEELALNGFHFDKLKFDLNNGKEFKYSIFFSQTKNNDITVCISRPVKTVSQKELINNSNQWKKLIDNIPDIILIYNIEGKIKYTNSNGLRLFNKKSLEEIIDIDFLDLVHPSFHDVILEWNSESEKGITQGFDEIKVLRSPGNWTDVSIRSVFTEYQNEPAIQVIMNNLYYQKQLIQEKMRAELAEEINTILKFEIKEHKETQAKLKAAEEVSTSIINSSLDMIITVDLNFKITEFNRAAQERFGYTRKSVLGKTTSFLFANEEEADKILQIFKEERDFSGEVKNKSKDGKEFISLLSASRLINTEGKPFGYMSVSRDISSIKDAEKKLKFSEERYRDLFENATDLIQSVNKKGNINYVNKSWFKTLGYEESELSGLNFFNLVKDSEKNKFKKHFSNIWEGRDPGIIKSVLINKSGKEIFIEANSNLRYTDDQPFAIRSIIRDITDAVHAELIVQKQSAKIEAIFNSGSLMFWTVNSEIGLTSFNRKYFDTIYEMYGVYPQLHFDIHKSREKFTTEQYHQFWEKKYERVFKGQTQNFQTKTINKNGEEVYREIYLNPIRDTIDKSKILEVAGIGMDITDKKMAEKRLNEQASKINSIFNSTSLLVWSVDKNYKITSFNTNFAKYTKEKYGHIIGVNDDALEFINKRSTQERDRWENLYSRVLKGTSFHFENKDIDKSREVWEEIFLNPIYDEDGNISEISAILQHITYKKQAERKIKEQAAKIKSIFDSTAMVIYTLDSKMRVTSFNKNLASNLYSNFGKEVAIGENFLKLVEPFYYKMDLKSVQKYYQEAFKGGRMRFEASLTRVDGEIMWIETFINPILMENGEIKEISCMSHEITEKKINEAKIIGSLHEKEILLQEVHHRVKNNLQVISSILNLQSSYVKDVNTLNILKESQNRIKSMSFIHESLYQTKDFSFIDFSDYILSLSKNLFHSYIVHPGQVKLETDFEEVTLNLDQAIPCGLIVNELVSNAFKYAFPKGRKGQIDILLKEKNKTIYFGVKDNGIGLPENFDIENSDSLGLQLVFTLVEQLDGTIEFSSKEGTEYLIKFVRQ